MTIDEIKTSFGKIGIIPVVVLDDVKDAEPLADALYRGGLPCAEVTFRTAAAEEATQDAGNDDVSVQEDADPVTEEQSSEEENTSVPVIVPTEPKTETYKPGEGSDEDTDLLQSFVDEKVKEDAWKIIFFANMRR